MPPFASREPGAQFVLDCFDRGLALLSGPVAERQATGDCIAGSADLLEARMIAGALAISYICEAQYVRLFEREARALVARLWCEITAVADALLERQTLTGDEIDLVLARWRSPVQETPICQDAPLRLGSS